MVVVASARPLPFLLQSSPHPSLTLFPLQVPHNKAFHRRMEFNDLAAQLFPRWLYILTVSALIFNFQASNISSIVVSAQTMDSTLVRRRRRRGGGGM